MEPAMAMIAGFDTVPIVDRSPHHPFPSDVNIFRSQIQFELISTTTFSSSNIGNVTPLVLPYLISAHYTPHRLMHPSLVYQSPTAFPTLLPSPSRSFLRL
ncbi:hypothetical protein EVAR_63430_1 [Eumeta japonica]|uniref:Uncharacterized protein n=1 Tax=Eumeta variegata TaxID=151549 RepID=A0A4C1YWM4_EUMVA|nr:hypothetical protein EVAR_63430_1 [Eumeta japonica]